MTVDFEQAIRDQARALELDDCRFTTAEPPASAPHFRNWLDGQRHGEMSWLARQADRRTDPQQVLPGARSIVMVAAVYEAGIQAQHACAVDTNCANRESPHPPGGHPLHEPPRSDGLLPLPHRGRGQGEGASDDRGGHGEGRGEASPNESSRFEPLNHGDLSCQTSENSPSPIGWERAGVRVHGAAALFQPKPRIRMPESPASGYVACYARHADYHDVLGEKLEALARFINQLGGADTRSICYTDTGPVLERDLAQRAGLGFIGKHTNLISRQHGNWLLLGEILTTLPLRADPPERNRCGSCVRCLAACPTQAITAPFQLDARRCLSYLTIELKGSIPLAFRPALGNRIFGCDDCLAVCPWNRFAQAGALMRQHLRSDLAAPDLLELLALDDAGFKARFAGTPIYRSKRRGLLRNVCVALGNTGDATALPALAKLASDSDPLLQDHAQWAIEEINKRIGRAHGPPA